MSTYKVDTWSNYVSPNPDKPPRDFNQRHTVNKKMVRTPIEKGQATMLPSSENRSFHWNSEIKLQDHVRGCTKIKVNFIETIKTGWNRLPWKTNKITDEKVTETVTIDATSRANKKTTLCTWSWRENNCDRSSYSVRWMMTMMMGKRISLPGLLRRFGWFGIWRWCW